MAGEVRGFNSLSAQVAPGLQGTATSGSRSIDSERQLRQWLDEDGVTYTTGDLSPVLTLLEATGWVARGGRAATGLVLHCRRR
jgi:hypothetical protein